VGGFQERDRGRDDRISGHSGNKNFNKKHDKFVLLVLTGQYEHCTMYRFT